MLERVDLRSTPEVRQVIQRAFPSYKKHSAFLSVFPESGLHINSYWSGGSKDEFAVVELATGKRIPLPTFTHPHFDIAGRGLANTENKDIEIDGVGSIRLKHLPEGFALVAGGIFCGKTATAHVYINPANLARLLLVKEGE